MDALSAEPAGERSVVEEGERLSRSVLWRLQRRYYEALGVNAWSRGPVPHYATNNAFLADAYARLLLARLADLRAAGTAGPVHAVELGAGSGRLAYQILVQLAKRLPADGGGPGLVYVLSDASASVVEHWRGHAALRPFVAAGRLDFALFDPTRDSEVALLESGWRLTPAAPGPLMAIANYFFDSIPHDMFYVDGGVLHESLVRVLATGGEPDLDDVELLSRLEVEYARRPVTGDYYGEPRLDAILRGYRDRLARTAVSLPTAGIRCLETLADLSGGDLLVIAADKGHFSEAELAGGGEQGLVLHGSFSMSVNFHALEEAVASLGGAVLGSTPAPQHLGLAVYGLTPPEGRTDAVRAVCEEVCGRFGPDELLSLRFGVVDQLERLGPDQLLAFLQLCCWDAKDFAACASAFLKRDVAALTPALRRRLVATVEKVWERYLPLGEETDLAFVIGLLLYRIRAYVPAIEFFTRSLALYGEDANAHSNIALCYYELQQWGPALEHVEASLRLDPDSDVARRLRVEVLAERGS